MLKKCETHLTMFIKPRPLLKDGNNLKLNNAIPTHTTVNTSLKHADKYYRICSNWSYA